MYINTSKRIYILHARKKAAIIGGCQVFGNHLNMTLPNAFRYFGELRVF